MAKRTLAELDLYYLRSIQRQLDDLADDLTRRRYLPSIGSEVLNDNRDWLANFINRMTPDRPVVARRFPSIGRAV